MKQAEFENCTVTEQLLCQGEVIMDGKKIMLGAAEGSAAIYYSGSYVSISGNLSVTASIGGGSGSGNLSCSKISCSAIYGGYTGGDPGQMSNYVWCIGPDGKGSVEELHGTFIGTYKFFVNSGILRSAGASGAEAYYAIDSNLLSKLEDTVTEARVKEIIESYGYATQTWVTNKGYTTLSAVANQGYVTKSYVDTNGMVLENEGHRHTFRLY
jgi:hypothetical protein